jgi:hypothetical protein
MRDGAPKCASSTVVERQRTDPRSRTTQFPNGRIMALGLLSTSTMRRHQVLFAVFCLALSLVGCVATVEPEPVYADATYVPTDIERYPYVVYEGRPVYYVHDRWYARDGSRWVYYRSEPTYLREQRTYIRQAPPAYRQPVYAAPPAPPPARPAPPAQQVR